MPGIIWGTKNTIMSENELWSLSPSCHRAQQNLRGGGGRGVCCEQKVPGSSRGRPPHGCLLGVSGAGAQGASGVSELPKQRGCRCVCWDSRCWDASGEGARQSDNHNSVGWLIQQRCTVLLECTVCRFFLKRSEKAQWTYAQTEI